MGIGRSFPTSQRELEISFIKFFTTKVILGFTEEMAARLTLAHGEFLRHHWGKFRALETGSFSSQSSLFV